MFRRSVALLVGLVLLAAVPFSAAAAGTLDQSQTTTTWIGFSGGGYPAQTFTAGASGLLDTVSVHVRSMGNPSLDSTVFEIRSTSGGLPTSTVLATQTATVADGWNDVTFTTPALIESGTQYALIVHPSNSIGWNGVCTDTYAGGQALYLDAGVWKTLPQYETDHPGMPAGTLCGLDFAFRTYVSEAWDLAVQLDITPASVPQGAKTPLTLSFSVINTGVGPTTDHVYVYADADFEADSSPAPVVTCTPPGSCDNTAGSAMDLGVMDADATITYSFTGTYDSGADALGATHMAIIAVCVGAIDVPNLRRPADEGVRDGNCWFAVAEFTVGAAAVTPTPVPHITPPPTSGHPAPTPSGSSPLAAVLLLSAFAIFGATQLARRLR